MSTTKNTFTIPDPLASNEDKLKDSYGLNFAKSIQQEWFGGGLINDKCIFSKRHIEIKRLRKYYRGEQDTQVYKDLAARQENDKSYLNLKWTPTNYAEKFVNNVHNGISDENYNLDIRSADKFAVLNRQKKLLNHKKNMYSKDMLERAKALQGIDLVPKGFVPENEEELSLYNQIKERPKQEIAEEILIKFVKNVSSWNYIKKEANKDAVITDLQVARVFTHPTNGVTVEYVDPESYGHSFVERNDFNDAYYHFVVDTITINDIRKESGFSEKKCRKIAKLYGDTNNGSDVDYDTCDLNKILNYRINVMHFTFKSDKEQVHKAYYDKKGNLKKTAKRDSTFKVPEGSERSRISKRLDTWYEGTYIVGSNEYIYNYKESENIAFDEMDRAISPFIAVSTNLYKNQLKSFLSNITSTIDDLILTDLKIQHLMLELKPDLIEIDIDQLADLGPSSKGEDNKQKNYKEALSILQTKGVVLKKRVNMGEEGMKDGASARPIPNQQGSALTALLNIWAHYYNLIRETTGINPARDGSLPPDALLGVNEMNRLASNTNTKHIVDAAVSFDKKICESISTRIKSIFTLKEEAVHLVKMYTNAVGKHNIEALESLKDRHLHEFGFTVEMVPAKAELDELKQDLGIALQEGTIDVSEKAEILRHARSSMKQAIEYMRYVRNRKIKERNKQVMLDQKLQSQSNSEAARVKIEGEMQSYQMKAQVDLQKEMQLSTLRLKEYSEKLSLDAPKEQKEFEQKAYLEQIKNLQTINLTKYKEDQKTEREKENSSRQSTMIEQRQKQLGAFDFSNKINLKDILASA